MNMSTCLECPHHMVINDLDPEDWFCDDDQAVVCSLLQNPTRDLSSKYGSVRNQYKVVMPAIRPYNLEKESVIPHWCPNNNNKEMNHDREDP